eukprot:scaffold10700_cov108-Isochrysis_galbana.AAC.3
MAALHRTGTGWHRVRDAQRRPCLGAGPVVAARRAMAADLLWDQCTLKSPGFLTGASLADAIHYKEGRIPLCIAEYHGSARRVLVAERPARDARARARVTRKRAQGRGARRMQ